VEILSVNRLSGGRHRKLRYACGSDFPVMVGGV
jgi:hypothetical protein